MADKTRVAVCGSCVYMIGIALGLQASPALNVMHIKALPPAFPKSLAGLAPAVITFDLKEAARGLAGSPLEERPGLLLVGVEQATDEMLLLSSGQRATVRSVDAFLELIGIRENGSAGRQIAANA